MQPESKILAGSLIVYMVQIFQRCNPIIRSLCSDPLEQLWEEGNVGRLVVYISFVVSIQNYTVIAELNEYAGSWAESDWSVHLSKPGSDLTASTAHIFFPPNIRVRVLSYLLGV